MDLDQAHQTSPDQPLVSVVIPTFNAVRFLAQAIESVLAQDYRPIEIVAVDDGSTDATADFLRAQPNLVCIHQAHGGASAARNTGVAAARGSILAFLDSDDLWPADRLTVALAPFAAHPEIGYVLGKQRFFVEPGCSAPAWVRPEWLVEPQDASNIGVLLARRETFARVGPFNTGYASGEDTEWLLRAREAGVPMARLPEVVLHRRLHDANLSVASFAARKATLARLARESIERLRGSGTA